MTQGNQRRQFLRLLGMGGLTTFGLAEGQESHGDTPKREFRGVSRSGDIAEAPDAASCGGRWPIVTPPRRRLACAASPGSLTMKG